jgi:hypothetical protein
MIKLLSTLQYCIKPFFVYDVIAGMFLSVLHCHHGNIPLQYGEFVLESITLLINVQYTNVNVKPPVISCVFLMSFSLMMAMHRLKHVRNNTVNTQKKYNTLI